MLIRLNTFGGMVPGTAPHLLPQNAAQIATNCKLVSGALRAWRTPLFVETPVKAGTKKSIFLYEDQYWFHWLDDVDCVYSPIAQDAYRRVYWTGDDAPKMTELSIAVGGPDYPTASYLLGIPAPATSPSVTISDVEVHTITAITQAEEAQITSEDHGLSTGDRIVLDVEGMTDLDGWEGLVTWVDDDNFTINVDTTEYDAFTSGTFTMAQDETLFEDRYYVVTYVSAYGEEGPPCLPSELAIWKPGRTATVASLPTVPTGNYNITHKKVYRVNTGSSDSAYQLVLTDTYPDGLIPVATTSILDDCADDELGAALESAEWDAPPEDMAGLIALPNGAMCGFSGKSVCFSERNRPHAWPLSYRISVDHPIVSIGAFGTSVLVTTTGMPYVITGEEPGSMGREKMEIGQACVSKRGTVDMGYAVLYPAPDGLVMAGTGTLKMATDGVLTRDEWQAFKPESVHAYLYAGQYIGFYDTGSVQGGFAFDPATGTFSTFDLYATGGFSDPATGNLYLIVDGDIVKWDAGATYIDYQWKSRPFYATAPLNLGCAQVFADTYDDLTFKVYADGVLKHTQTVASSRPFRLPSGFRANRWEVELLGVNGVNVVSLASTMSELGQAA